MVSGSTAMTGGEDSCSFLWIAMNIVQYIAIFKNLCQREIHFFLFFFPASSMHRLNSGGSAQNYFANALT
jgi:hypothetical protein